MRRHQRPRSAGAIARRGGSSCPQAQRGRSPHRPRTTHVVPGQHRESRSRAVAGHLLVPDQPGRSRTPRSMPPAGGGEVTVPARSSVRSSASPPRSEGTGGAITAPAPVRLRLVPPLHRAPASRRRSGLVWVGPGGASGPRTATHRPCHGARKIVNPREPLAVGSASGATASSPRTRPREPTTGPLAPGPPGRACRSPSGQDHGL